MIIEEWKSSLIKTKNTIHSILKNYDLYDKDILRYQLKKIKVLYKIIRRKNG